MDRSSERPDRRQIVEQLYAEYARTNTELGLVPDASKPDAYEDNVLALLRSAGVKSGDLIVDLACGDGRKLASLRRAGYAELIGCDRYVEPVTGDIVHVRQDMLEFLKSSSRPIKCVILYDIVEHLDVPEIVELLRTAAGRLADGGIIVVRTTNGASPLSGLYYYGDLTHRTLLNEHSFAQIAQLTGLVLDRVLPEGIEGARYSAPKRILARIGNRVLRAGLAVAGLLAFRRRFVLTPNFSVVLRPAMPKK